jgi:hypothetical protein
MKPQAQAAFVQAYGRCVAQVPEAQVAEFVKRYANGEEMEYSGDYTSIMDSLLMWHDAILWQLEQGAKA